MATSIANRFDALSGLQIKDAHLEAVLRGKEFLVHDGGMGTMLQAAGLAGAGVVPDLLNLSHPAEVSAIHKAYVDAGAQAISTNTFGANRHKLEGRAAVAEVFQAAAENVRAAGAPYVVADIGPIGELMQPMGTLSFEEAYSLFAEQVDAAVAAGCDIILLETLSDLSEARAALLAAKEHSDLPVFVTMTFEEDGRTFLGTPPEVAAATLSAMGANAVGMNCSLGPAEALGFAKTLAAFSRVPVLILLAGTGRGAGLRQDACRLQPRAGADPAQRGPAAHGGRRDHLRHHPRRIRPGHGQHHGSGRFAGGRLLRHHAPDDLAGG